MEDPSTSREALCWPYDERGMRERGMIALVLHVSRSLDGHRDTNQTGGCTKLCPLLRKRTVIGLKSKLSVGMPNLPPFAVFLPAYQSLLCLSTHMVKWAEKRRSGLGSVSVPVSVFPVDPMPVQSGQAPCKEDPR